MKTYLLSLFSIIIFTSCSTKKVFTGKILIEKTRYKVGESISATWEMSAMNKDDCIALFKKTGSKNKFIVATTIEEKKGKLKMNALYLGDIFFFQYYSKCEFKSDALEGESNHFSIWF